MFPELYFCSPFFSSPYFPHEVGQQGSLIGTWARVITLQAAPAATELQAKDT
jgi:hypothetical protein